MDELYAVCRVCREELPLTGYRWYSLAQVKMRRHWEQFHPRRLYRLNKANRWI